MKVLLVVSSYAPNTGGLQTVTRQLARELQARAHNVTVVTNRYPRTLPPYQVLDGVPVIRWLFLAPRLRQLSNLRPDLFLAGWFCFPLTLIRLVALLRRTKPDIVNLHFVGAPALFVLLARWFLSFRLVVSLHGDDIEGLGRGNGFDRWVFHSILRRAEVVTACSRNLLEQAVAVEPAVRDKGRVVYNGVDLPPASATSYNSHSLLAAGRMIPKKGFDVLLRAQARTRGEWQLTLIGDGPEREKLERLAGELGLNGHVKFLANQRRTQVLEAMAACDLVVVPSRQEPFGMVALEGMALGKPVVATRVGGLSEVLEGADALLVEPDDPAQLAKAIDSALERLGIEPAFGARNVACANRFSTKQMVNGYLETYKA
jgi:glycogen(starch) synthase